MFLLLKNKITLKLVLLLSNFRLNCPNRPETTSEHPHISSTFIAHVWQEQLSLCFILSEQNTWQRENNSIYSLPIRYLTGSLSTISSNWLKCLLPGESLRSVSHLLSLTFRSQNLTILFLTKDPNRSYNNLKPSDFCNP